MVIKSTFGVSRRSDKNYKDTNPLEIRWRSQKENYFSHELHSLKLSWRARITTKARLLLKLPQCFPTWHETQAFQSGSMFHLPIAVANGIGELNYGGYFLNRRAARKFETWKGKSLGQKISPWQILEILDIAKAAQLISTRVPHCDLKSELYTKEK